MERDVEGVSVDRRELWQRIEQREENLRRTVVDFAGEAGAPGVGTTGYQYRISMTQASGTSDCVMGFTLNFGPHKPLPYPSLQ